MVNWSLRIIEKIGNAGATICVTLVIVFISVSISYLDSIIFGYDLFPSLYLSTAIPLIVAPPTIFFLIHLVKRLGRAEMEVATIIESAGDAFLIHDLSGKFVEVNDMACCTLGYTRDELLGMSLSDIQTDRDSKLLSEIWREMKAGTAVTLEGEHLRKDGSTFPVEARLSIFHYGKEANILALVRDISNRVRDKLALQTSEEKYRNLVETSHDFIWSVDADGIFTFVNEASKRTHGYDPHEMIGKPFFDFMTEEQAEKDLAIFEKIKDGIEYFNLDSIHLKKDGSPVYLNFNAIVERGADGNVLGTTGSAKDISEQKNVEEQSRIHREQLAHVTRVATLGEMATDIAHELNQPLAAIAAFIDGSLRRLKSGEVTSESIINALEKASEQAVRAGDVIQHLRDLIRRDDRKSEHLDINDSIDKVLQLLKADLSNKQIKLLLELTDDAPIVRGDPILLEQVILNLVRNSVDILGTVESDRRQLKISSHIESRLVSIIIKDNGPGVAEKYQDQLFEPYFTTKKTGLGMGLPICRSIINEHDGQIWYASEPNQGATFHIQIPLSTSNVNSSSQLG
ncbi:MAG: PAS domain S-box protein [Rhodospirillaceae bacterium]|nr:PAS domain S-box protein [Rhodospirillaceae bacterium]